MPLREPTEVLIEIEQLLSGTDSGVSNLRYELSHYPVPDLADVFNLLSDNQRLRILNNMESPAIVAELISELNPVLQRDLLSQLDKEHLSEIAKEMDLDDLVDLLEQIPDDLQNHLVESIETEDRAAVNELKQYASDSAGGLMTSDYLAVGSTATAQQVFQRIREEEDVETVNYIYIVDDAEILLGVLSLRELISLEPAEAVEKILNKDVISVHVDDDQEEVAEAIEKYNFHTIPVINRNGKLKGIITVDDIVDVIQEEASEDMMIMAGAGSNADLLHENVWRQCRARLPWLILTTVGGMIAAFVLSQFRTTLENSLAVSFFVPMIMAVGGATGNQSSTILVRSLALGHLEGRSVWWIIRSEIAESMLIGFACALFIMTAMTAIHFSGIMTLHSSLPWIIGISIFLGIQVAATLGTIFPLACEKLGIDPALAAGPLIASLNDILGILIYLTVSATLLEYMN